jgi:cell division topological specificity factor
MGLFSFFKKEKKKNTASLAKERLQILIAHEHSDKSATPDYLPKLQKELIGVIRKYVKVDDNAVNVKVEKGDTFDVLELNITLPESN